jgi:hypothetical protein
MPGSDFRALLERLSSSGVEFTVVGGAAAVLHGASLATYDLDVLIPFTRENCERLLQAVSPLHPRLSHTVDKRPLALTADQLAGFKNLYLLTDLGRLDVLGSLPPLPDAGEVLRASKAFDVGGVKVRVISLELLIQVKAAMTRPKDKLVEAELRAIASVRGGQSDGSPGGDNT